MNAEIIEYKEINWEEFNFRKQLEGVDSRFFSFKQWEKEFLVDKIHSVYPENSEQEIMDAISECYEAFPCTYPKIDFYKCVLKTISCHN